MEGCQVEALLWLSLLGQWSGTPHVSWEGVLGLVSGPVSNDK